MKNLHNLAQQFVHDESGQDLIEYALVAAVVALGAISALQTVAGALSAAFTQIGSTITSAI